MDRRDFLRAVSAAGLALGAGPGWAASGRMPRRPLGAALEPRTAAEAGPELATSLGRLRTGRLDLYQLHALLFRYPDWS